MFAIFGLIKALVFNIKCDIPIARETFHDRTNDENQLQSTGKFDSKMLHFAVGPDFNIPIAVNHFAQFAYKLFTKLITLEAQKSSIFNKKVYVL